MKKFIVFPILLSVVACAKAPEKITPKIDYPPLSNQLAFDNLQSGATEAVLNKENAQQVMTSFFKRVMNTLEIANQQVGRVTDNELTAAILKPGARSFEILAATKCGNDDIASHTNALVWEDVNEDDLPLAGDRWYSILNNCVNGTNSAIVTGVMEQSGMDDPFDQQTDEFSDYQYILDMQIDFTNSGSAFFQGVNITLARSTVSDVIQTSFVVKDDSKLGAKLGDQLYLIDVNSLSAVASDDGTELSLKYAIDSTYYLSTAEGNQFLTVTTPDELVFKYELDGDMIITPRLESGELKIIGANQSSMTLSADDADILRFVIDSDGDGNADLTFNTGQTEVFGTDFNLLNILGG